MKHLVRCLIAGLVALLPIAGTVLGISLLERTLHDALFVDAGFYFPGLGILASLFALYLIGLVVTTFVGRWLWRRVDRMFDRLPLVGGLYRTLKQILGYGEGADALFIEAVAIRARGTDGEELGLVTSEMHEHAGRPLRVVFVPGAPNPTAGRLLLVAPGDCRPLGVPVHELLKLLVSVGKTSPEFLASRGAAPAAQAH